MILNISLKCKILSNIFKFIFEMNNKLQPSFTSHEIPPSDSSRSSFEFDTKPGCLKLLSSCFRVRRKKATVAVTADHDAKEFDYVVEKLVVQRVPFLFVSIQGTALSSENDHTRESSNTSKEVDSARDNGNSSKEVSDCRKSLRKVNNMYSTVSETQSLLYCSDRLNLNMIPLDIPNKSLPSDIKATVLNKRNRKRTLPDDYHSRIVELMNTMSSLHPDLKENERPPKDPCPLNVKKNGSTSTNIFANKFLKNGNDNQMPTVFKSQTSLQEPILKIKELEIVNSSGGMVKNEQNVCYVNQIQNTPLDNLEDSYVAKYKEPIVQSVQNIIDNSKDRVTSIIGGNQINVHGYNEMNSELYCNHLSFTNEPKSLSECVANTDASNTILRWKIIVKHYETKTLHCTKASQGMRKYLNTS